MKANNSAVLSNDDLVVYTSLERLLSSTHAENLTRLYSSINDSLKNGIYPTSYLLRVRDFMNNKISYVSEHIKELHEKLLSLTNVNKQLSSIVKAHKKNNTIYLFDSINGAIKSKRKEDIVDEKVLIEYDMRDGSTYNSIVETDKNNIINNIKKAFEIGEEVFDVDSDSINKLLRDTLFVSQVYYQFSEYIRYIEFTLYNKDISMIKLYDNYLKILLKLKKMAENMINFINENKEDWKKKGIVVDDDSFLRDMYMSDEPYIFSKEEIQKSIYGDIFQRKLGI